jgi:DNA-binding HxlR family transcriptional regulator
MLLTDSRRFAELAASVPDLSDRMLAERLRELEHEGIVERTVTPTIPVRVEYSLTPMGRALEASIRALGDWAEKWLPADVAMTKGSPADAKLPEAKKAARGGSRR